MNVPGSRRSVQKLVDEHYRSLFRYAFRLAGGSAADAEDLTQEAFCHAQMKLDQLRDPSRAKAWLFSIVRNAYLHRLRDRRNEKLVPLDWIGEVPDRSCETLPDVEPEQLQQALDELAEPFRTPVILFYLEEFSYREIAEQMDLPMGTVMSRLARAKGYLRAKLLEASPTLVTDVIRRSS